MTEPWLKFHFILKQATINSKQSLHYNSMLRLQKAWESLHELSQFLVNRWDAVCHKGSPPDPPLIRANFCYKPSTEHICIVVVCLVSLSAWQGFKLACLSLKRQQWWNNSKDGGSCHSLNFSACVKYTSRLSFRWLHQIRIPINIGKCTLLWKRPLLWVPTQRHIRTVSITLTGSTGSSEVPQDRDFQLDWVFILE